MRCSVSRAYGGKAKIRLCALADAVNVEQGQGVREGSPSPSILGNQVIGFQLNLARVQVSPELSPNRSVGGERRAQQPRGS